MDEILINKPYAEIYEVKSLDQPNKNQLRIWCCQWPNYFTFQIRTHKGISGSGNQGVERDMIAHVDLSIEEFETILTKMKADLIMTPYNKDDERHWYILSDGRDTDARRRMNADELADANEIAKNATDDNWSWYLDD
jgi:hypothetical protein